ncbi:phospholipase A2 [Trichonephila inaurata madagascariensis]|uniref:Phospholipase A2 n=1 Tax=Trichonephila inaurata madagascariensis TaxID=2747483 RepID=A0A8X7CES6_9ARAC|nr:phospholipase A2 [Trichonephila inaurata madagascariensis]
MFWLLFFYLSASVAIGSMRELYQDVESNGSNETRVWMFYIEPESGRMISILRDVRKNTLIDCYASGDDSLLDAIKQTIPTPNITVVDKEKMDNLIGICTYVKQNGHLYEEDGEEVWQQFGVFSSFFIYPGTKWCGSGNVSEHYDDLGPEVEADMCCRDHDHCNESILGRERKYGLDNNSPFTKSHCDCDQKFYNCLKAADTRTSHRVGRLFFNFLQMACFREDYPVTGCKRYRGWFRRRCQEYEYDQTKDKIWQMFDAKHYEVNSDEDNEIGEYKGDVFEYMLRMVFDEEKYSELNKDFK